MLLEAFQRVLERMKVYEDIKRGEEGEEKGATEGWRSNARTKDQQGRRTN
jgi:predicted transposase YdaD